MMEPQLLACTNVSSIVQTPKSSSLAVTVRSHAGIIERHNCDALLEIGVVVYAANSNHHGGFLRRRSPGGQVDSGTELAGLPTCSHCYSEVVARSCGGNYLCGVIGVIAILIFLQETQDLWLATGIPFFWRLHAAAAIKISERIRKRRDLRE